MPRRRLAAVVEPNFYIDHVPVFGDVSLSPMAGFSDSPYRRLCRRRGAAFAFTEFVSAEYLCRGSQRSIDLFRFEDEERPVIFQIFGHDPRTLLYAAQAAEELGPDVIDINMGCSVKAVAHRGSGAGMLRDPRRTAHIFRLLRRHLHVPLTAKIRLGWDDTSRNSVELAQVLFESGAAMISVHGRTKQQGYQGQADWEAIGETAAAVPIPVLGNGDVRSLSEARARRRQYGTAGVLIGRAAIGNPWVFSSEFDGRTPAAPVTLDGMLEHLAHSLEFQHGKEPPERSLRLFRKHAARYLGLHPELAGVKTRLLTVEDVDDFRRISLDCLEKHEKLASLTV